MSKREYIPKNVRNGVKAQDAAKLASLYRGPFFANVRSFAHSRDINGNGTAHYTVMLETPDMGILVIVESGTRREQVGYSGQNEAALYALRQLGYELDLSKSTCYDWRGEAIYPLVNFPPVEC